MIKELSNFQQEIIESEGLTILEIYGPGCTPCKKVLAFLEPLSSNLSIYKANSSTNTSLTSMYSIKSVPTLLFFVDGELDKTVVGSDISEIMSSISSYVK